MDYQLSQHAMDALVKRKIPVEWVERVLESPQRTERDPRDGTLAHRLASVPEHGNRVLRLIVNLKKTPARVVTLYFDRKMKGKL
jgi:hypothetical protein